MRLLSKLTASGKKTGGLILFTFASFWLFLFKNQNFYVSEFFTIGSKLIFYQIQKIVFIPLIIASFYYTGKIIKAELPPAFQCMSGACFQVLVLFILGCSSILNSFFVYMLFLIPLLFFQYDHLNSIKNYSFKTKQKNNLNLLQQGLFFLVIILLYISKCAFPWGGHDFFTHYFAAYKFVIQNQSIWPNECWYHIFYGNWNFPAFYSMILLDNSCANFLTFVLVCLAAFCLQSCSGKHEQMTLGAAVYLGIYIFTPGFGIYKAHGGWGDFEKMHEMSGAFLLFYFLSLYKMLKDDDGESKTLRLNHAVILSSASIVLVNYNIGIVLFLATTLFGALILLFDKKTFQMFFKIASAQGMMLLIKSVILTFMIGLPSDKFLRILWPYISNHFLGFPALYTVLLKSFYLYAPGSPDSDFNPVEFFYSITYSKYVIPLIAFCILNFVIFRKYLKISPMCWSNRKVFKLSHCVYLNVIIFLFVFYAFLWHSRQFYISGFRFSSVLVGLYMFLIFSLFWKTEFKVSKSVKKLRALSIICMTVLTALLLISSWTDSSFRIYFVSRLKFLLGKVSFYDAYRNPNGQSGRLDWGAMHPGAANAVDLLPPNTPIWSFHVHTYCMKPGANIQTDFSFLGPDNYLDCVFGDVDNAENEFKKRGINYFLISKTLPTSDLLIFSPIFNPESIFKKISIIQEDSDNFLLTWRPRNPIGNLRQTSSSYKKLTELILHNRKKNNFFIRDMLKEKYAELNKLKKEQQKTTY